MLTVRSGSPPVAAVTCTVALAELENVVLDFVALAFAVLLSVVPPAALTDPWMVTFQEAPPASDLPLGIAHETLPLDCVQLPGLAESTRLVMPFTWSVTVTLLSA